METEAQARRPRGRPRKRPQAAVRPPSPRKRRRKGAIPSYSRLYRDQDDERPAPRQRYQRRRQRQRPEPASPPGVAADAPRTPLYIPEAVRCPDCIRAVDWNLYITPAPGSRPEETLRGGGLLCQPDRPSAFSPFARRLAVPWPWPRPHAVPADVWSEFAAASLCELARSRTT